MNFETQKNEKPPDDGWGDSSNWEYEEPQEVKATLPFRPDRNTKFLSDAHYFQSKNQSPKRRKNIIDDELPNLRTPSQSGSVNSSLKEIQPKEGWNEVFVASYNSVSKNKSVSDAWIKPIEGSGTKTRTQLDALLHRTARASIEGIPNPHENFSQDAKFTVNAFTYVPEGPITPEALCALYLGHKIKTETIRSHISKAQWPEQKEREEKKKKMEDDKKKMDDDKKKMEEDSKKPRGRPVKKKTDAEIKDEKERGEEKERNKMKKDEKKKENEEKDANSGRSASSWLFENLIDLSCVPLFDVDLAAMIPYKFKELEKEVIERIKDRYIVRRILDELTVATSEELSQFSSTHMSWFLLNPWCLFFTALRDLLSRGQAELNYDHKQVGMTEPSQKEDRNKMAEHGLSRLDETTVNDEEQEETTSEQLLHRFMEVILLLFSIICDSRDEYRSTPGKVKRHMYVGGLLCDIEDDGYVYISRAGTSGHGPVDEKRKGHAHWVKKKPTERKNSAIEIEVSIDEGSPYVSSDRSRFGTVPVIRYETKRLNTAKSRDLNVFSQIFSQLLAAAEMNMAYLEDVDTLQGNWLTKALGSPSVPEKNAKYHDAFVIHVIHHTLTIHTARFPESYLKWIKTTERVNGDAPENFAILYKVSAEYDLADPQKRLQAACDILILLWAIKHGKAAVDTSENSAKSNMAEEKTIATEHGPLFVARAVWKKDIKKNAAKKDTDLTNIGDDSPFKKLFGLEIHSRNGKVPDGLSSYSNGNSTNGMEFHNVLPGSFNIVN